VKDAKFLLALLELRVERLQKQKHELQIERLQKQNGEEDPVEEIQKGGEDPVEEIKSPLFDLVGVSNIMEAVDHAFSEAKASSAWIEKKNKISKKKRSFDH